MELLDVVGIELCGRIKAGKRGSSAVTRANPSGKRSDGQQGAGVAAAHNSFVGIEHLTDDEREEIRTTCERRAAAEKKAKRAADLVTE